MAEDKKIENNSRFSYLREQYGHKREEAEKTLVESGLEKDSSGFRNARRKFARKLLEARNEGEVDELTGILNRKGFERRLKEETERIKRFNETATLLIIDANNLKMKNDIYGHEEGDKYLKEIATSLLTGTRATDTVARIGGDEYGVIMVGIHPQTFRELWEERLVKIFDEKNISIAVGASEIDSNDIEKTRKEAD